MAAQAAKEEAEREIAALAEAKRRVVSKIMDPTTGYLTLTEENGEVTKVELGSPLSGARPPPSGRHTRAKETYLLLFAVFILGLSVPWRDASKWLRGRWVEHKIQGWETELQARDARRKAEKLANANTSLFKRNVVDEGIRRYKELAAVERKEMMDEQAQAEMKLSERPTDEPKKGYETEEGIRGWRKWFWKQDSNL